MERGVDFTEPRSIGLAVVEAVQDGVERYASYQEQWADNTPVEWIADLVRANARVTRTVGTAYARSARSVLK